MKTSQQPTGPVLVIDLGGTKFVTALVSPDGQIIAREYNPTLADEGCEAVVRRLLLAMHRIADTAGIPLVSVSTIAVAAAGAVDSSRGMVTNSPNLPGWQDIPLRGIVEKETGIRTAVVNDASAAALGELYFGAGQGVGNMIFLTVSTGIGGGIIIGGRLYTGSSGCAGEIGHTTVDINGPRCSCGNIGCLEMLASGKAVAREAQRLVRQGGKTILTELAEGEVSNITAQTVAAAAQQRDPVALSVVSRAAEYLGVGMVNLVNIFNPEVIVVGGGMAKMGDALLDGARKVVLDRAFNLPAQTVRIVAGHLGDNAGVLGAVAWLKTLEGSP
jgi:glucokinase